MSMSYPRPIREIHQIEMTSRCNLRCKYCPHFPKLPRPMEDMERDTWLQALELVAFYCRQGTQTELSLTGIGESLLHPNFVEMAIEARSTIGEHRQLTITTNGLLLDEVMCAALAPLRPKVFVSLHRPEKAAPAVEAARRHGILAGINNSFVTSAFDWAGYQKNWTQMVSAPKIKCEYLRSGWGVILVDGRITTCCLDAEAKAEEYGGGVIGTVWDAPAELKLKPWEGCESCHMETP